MKPFKTVIAPKGCESYLTAGKEYDVIDLDLQLNTSFDNDFWFIGDDGIKRFSTIQESLHLGFKDWIIKDESKQSPDWKEIVIQLRTVADQKGITQEQIAKKTSMIQSAISRVFALKFIPKLSTIILIADALGVELKITDIEKE